LGVGVPHQFFGAQREEGDRGTRRGKGCIEQAKAYEKKMWGKRKPNHEEQEEEEAPVDWGPMLQMSRYTRGNRGREKGRWFEEGGG